MKHTHEAMREMADVLLTRVFDGHLIVDKELDRAAAMLRDIANEMEAYHIVDAAPADHPEYPQCSGNPASCSENEGYGCCRPNPSPKEEEA
jgi:hypothetical protein